MIRYLRKSSAVAALAMIAGAVLVTTPSAQADGNIYPGKPPATGEQNVLFGAIKPGLTINGATNQSNTPVLFTSTQELTTGGIGQAFLRATLPDAVITGEVTFTVPGFGFLDYILNPTVTGPNATGGPARITAVTTDGATFTQNIQLGNGNNFWTLTTEDNEVISSVTLTPLGNTNYATYRQPRVSGICVPGEAGCAAVPTRGQRAWLCWAAP